MQKQISNAVGTCTFDSLKNSGALVHAISTRHGGVSPAPFDTLNLSTAVGDVEANAHENLARLHHTLDRDPRATVDAKQAQADQVAMITARERGTRIANVDALITNQPGVNLLLRFADCVPILFYDPAHHAIGIAHAGWRGTVMKIATNTVNALRDAFGTRPRYLIVGIAPSICPCCYRVGDDVIARVRDAFANADELLIAQNGAIHFDLWQANASQLRALGVEQIEIAQICTAHRTDDFFSWRAEKGNTGRFGAVIGIRD